MDLSKYIGEATEYDKKAMLEEKKPRFKSDNDNFTLILPNLNYNPEKGRKKGPEKRARKTSS